MSTFYDRALNGHDAATLATRVRAFELDADARSIHVETLLCLLRDAYQQRNPGAVSFVRPFLDGLLPDAIIAAHEQAFSAAILGSTVSALAPTPAPPSGGLKVEAAKPLPVQPSPAARVAPRQTLSW